MATFDHLRQTARQLGSGLLDVVYPVSDPIDPQVLTFLDEPCCARCGFPFEFRSALDATDCAACTARPPRYDRARSAFAYEVGLDRHILAFKHGGRTHNLSMFAAQMMRVGQGMLADADALVPVPLHPSRLRRRKFNQAALLAARISKLSNVPHDAHCLHRAKNTDSQGRKTPAMRRRNVAAAFTARNAPEHVVLVDDVMTTGATLEACALALRRAGARRVDALTLARVVRAREEGK